MAWAQPINDNCSGLIDLGVAPACPEGVFYTNVGATASDIGFENNPTCFNGGGTQRDVWFSFIASDTLFDYTITVTGLTDGAGSTAMLNPQIALYRGDCEVDGLAELLCVSAENGENIVELDALGLTPNVVYFIRINDYSATATPNSGTFQLCVGPLQPVNTIDEGGSTLCSGELYDSGGPDGDYSDNENHVFTICPSQPHSCINFSLTYYNIEASEFIQTDNLVFYDGDGVNPANIIGQVGDSNFGGDFGGGGVCYSVQASSGCLTVQFVSDGSNTFEGFAGSWECSALACDPPQSIDVQSDITETDIIDFISTPQTIATITNIDCPQNAYGIFEGGDDTDLGLERGLLLTSGGINLAFGPNDQGGATQNNNAPGDADLDYLSSLTNGETSNDACILELDVFAATNELTFEYIFGSEEYPEYVNDIFNDIFAFLISGPGIVGDPNIGNQLNIAVLPNGNNTPVEINSVNNLTNWEYFRNNIGGLSTQYDGLTSDYLGVKKSLTARAQVLPCNTYHLKLAIADRGDFSFDSGVFISELRGGTPDVAVRFNSGIDYLIEDCTNVPDEVVIRLNSALEDTVTYKVTIGGTATLNVDYLLTLPSQITFLPGQTEFSFPIQVLSDLLAEGTETITISLTNDFGCGEVVYVLTTIELRDELIVEISAGQDTVLVCEGGSISLVADGAATYFWTPPSLFSNPSIADPVLTPTASGWVTVTGNVGPCVDVDSIYVQIVAPTIEVTALDPIAICQGDNVRLVASNNVNNQNLTWTPADGLNDPNSPTPIASPQFTTTYTASVEVAGCIVTDTITIDVSPFEFPVLNNDTTICENYSVQLAELFPTGSVTTTYLWSPAESLNDPTISGPIATPDVTTTYQLTAISANGACTNTAEVTVTVLAADVAITNPDTTEICLGTSITLTAVTNTGNANNLVWSPNNGTLSDTTGLNVVATPVVSGWYYSSFQVGQCAVFDSVYVRVDSLPLGSIMATPDKRPYCEGDLVVFTSETYETGNFPDIQHLWQEGPGYETSDTLWNMVVLAADTFTYNRITTNRACRDTSSITIYVVEGVEMSITPSDTLICPGQAVQLQLNYGGQGEITWEPAENLSCTDCFNPIATPPLTVEYKANASEGSCVQEAVAQIRVVSLPIVNVIEGFEVCATNVIPTQLVTGTDAVSTYLITSSTDPNFVSTNPFISVSPQTTTTYSVAATNQCTTIVREVRIVVVEEPDLAVIPDQTICLGFPATFTAVTDAGAGVTQVFNWTYNNQTVTGNPVTVSDIDATSSVVLNYTYGPGAGCGTLQEVFTVNVIDITNSSVVVETSRDTVYQADTLRLTAIVDPEIANATFKWFANGVEITGATGESIIVQPADLGEIKYSVQVISPQGCVIGSPEVSVIVLEPAYQIPRAFTPNNDDRNDLFRIVHSGVITVAEFRIYNRWGQMVYESQTNEGWDGTQKGNPAPSDVYIYRLRFNLGGQDFSESGDVTLLR